MQDRGRIQGEQVVLGRCNGSHEAGNGNVLPRPESAAQRRRGRSFHFDPGKINAVPHDVPAIGGYAVQTTGECQARVRIGNQRCFPSPGQRITQALTIGEPIVVAALGVDDRDT